MAQITVRVPATSANLGPGFDCLALALDIWNETIFSLEGDGYTAVITGEGAGKLPKDESNLIIQSALKVFALKGRIPEPGLLVRCFNNIPVSSGLGSSAAAILTGMLGANALMNSPLGMDEILSLAAESEGHADNVAAALYGGLTMVGSGSHGFIARKVWDGNVIADMLQAVIVLPDFQLSTKAARAALPKKVSMADAVNNLSKTALVVQAFQSADLGLLGEVMDDQIHQPYRLPLIPGAQAALEAARQSGAAGAALSGAGPSLIAFGLEDMNAVAVAMKEEFKKAGLTSKSYLTKVVDQAAMVIIEQD